MLNWWAEILPLFIVRLIARAKCERLRISGVDYVTARRDVLFKEGGDK